MIKLKIETPQDIFERYNEMMFVIPIETIRETTMTIMGYELNYDMKIDRVDDTIQIINDIDRLYSIMKELNKQDLDVCVIDFKDYTTMCIIDLINTTNNKILIFELEEIKKNIVNYILNTKFRLGLINISNLYDEYNIYKYKIEQRG